MKNRIKIKIKLENGQIIERVPKVFSFGNFQMMIVRYKGEEYLVGDGDEYLRGGLDNVFALGRKMGLNSDIVSKSIRKIL